ncbi:MAG TPA: peptidylprolyl isomerase, partial [Clostridia bacterium]|nr:peptidylprolyl isomerase [Clostridia bacterium]
VEAEEEIIADGTMEEAEQKPADENKPKSNKLIIAVLITAVVAGAACFGIGRMTAVPADSVVAKVNGEAITKDDLYENLKGQYGKDALDQLIAEKIIELELKKQNVTVSEEDTQKELQEMISQYGGQEQFDALLANYGYSMEDFTKNIVTNLKLKKLLEPKITITEEEMKTYFEQNKDTFAVQEQVKASHILVDSEAKAKEVKDKLAAGGDFAELAKEYSIDTGSSQSGGELGLFPRDTMVKEFEDAAFSLQPGTISEPVQTKYGYHIIKVEERIEAKPAVYEENTANIKDTLFEQKLPDAYNTWMEEKYSEYEIENLL